MERYAFVIRSECELNIAFKSSQIFGGIDIFSSCQVVQGDVRDIVSPFEKIPSPKISLSAVDDGLPMFTGEFRGVARLSGKLANGDIL